MDFNIPTQSHSQNQPQQQSSQTQTPNTFSYMDQGLNSIASNANNNNTNNLNNNNNNINPNQNQTPGFTNDSINQQFNQQALTISQIQEIYKRLQQLKFQHGPNASRLPQYIKLSTVLSNDPNFRKIQAHLQQRAKANGNLTNNNNHNITASNTPME
ncbi:hypothetical protein CANINC_004933, partial [Pichia inconspicua]